VSRALLLAALLLAPGAARADTLSKRQHELRVLQDKITEKNRERRKTDMRARELQEEVSRISGELRSSRRALKEIDGKLRETEKRRADAENRLWAARLDVKQWNRTLSADLRALYERRLAAGSGRFVELAWRRRLAEDKVAGMTAAVARHAENRAFHDEIIGVKNELESLKGRRASEADRARDSAKEMEGVLETVQGRRAVLQEEIQELNASAKRFETLIRDLVLERERRAAAAAAKPEREKPEGRKASARARRKPAAGLPDFGKLSWPIAGSVVERFGKFKHPELDTVVVSNGIKIRPAQPGPVRAVAAGEALYAGEFMGYGLMALVAHPDNLFTIYAHLGELSVKKGQKVSVGEALGRSGTGDDRAVYFELRLHGEAMDPLLWLK
jgi:murein hydrolase activator